MKKFQEKQIRFFIFIIGIALSVFGAYLFLTYYWRSLAIDTVEAWLASDNISFQQGQALPALARAQRILFSSNVLTGITLYDSDNETELASYGEKPPFDRSYVTKMRKGTISYQYVSPFTAMIVYPRPDHPHWTLVFKVRPKGTILLVSLTIGLLILWVFVLISMISFAKNKEKDIIITVLFSALDDIIEQKPISKKLAAFSPDLDFHWKALVNKVTALSRLQRQIAMAEENARLSRQVAHDIRSPLSALDVAMKSNRLEDPSVARIVIAASSRIRGIADELLKQSRINQNSHSDKPATKCSILFDSIKALMDEKRIEFSSNHNLELLLPPIDIAAVNASNCEVPITTNSVLRIVSNVINNAIEAIYQNFSPSQSGRIMVLIDVTNSTSIDFGSQSALRIRIFDNGPGIPADLLLKLGNQEISRGKSQGNGIGLIGARIELERHGCKIRFDSKLSSRYSAKEEFLKVNAVADYSGLSSLVEMIIPIKK
jgi:signal transduction histidine kinase